MFEESLISTRLSGAQEPLSDQRTSWPSPKLEKGKATMLEYKDQVENESIHALNITKQESGLHRHVSRRWVQNDTKRVNLDDQPRKPSNRKRAQVQQLVPTNGNSIPLGP